eukprot:Opistho-2@76799
MLVCMEARLATASFNHPSIVSVASSKRQRSIVCVTEGASCMLAAVLSATTVSYAGGASSKGLKRFELLCTVSAVVSGRGTGRGRGVGTEVAAGLTVCISTEESLAFPSLSRSDGRGSGRGDVAASCAVVSAGRGRGVGVVPSTGLGDSGRGGITGRDADNAMASRASSGIAHMPVYSSSLSSTPDAFSSCDSPVASVAVVCACSLPTKRRMCGGLGGTTGMDTAGALSKLDSLSAAAAEALILLPAAASRVPGYTPRPSSSSSVPSRDASEDSQDLSAERGFLPRRMAAVRRGCLTAPRELVAPRCAVSALGSPQSKLTAAAACALASREECTDCG